MGNDVEEIEKRVAETREKNTAYRSYDGSDSFVFEGKEVFSVLDFWKYMYSNLNTIVSDLGEFFVAKALGIEKAENTDYWTAYDMSYKNQRIEVKSTQYVHPWNKTRVSKTRTFSIEPTRNSYWEAEGTAEYTRQNDVYVFCINQNQDINNHDPLNIDSWEFFVVPTFKINSYAGERQKKISLNVVKRLSGGGVSFSGLRQKVDETIDYIKNIEG